LQNEPIAKKGWLLDVMKQIDLLSKKQFILTELYARAESLQKLHPGNNNIQAKIRQQLQFLRDKGYLSFIGDGVYRLR